MATFFQNAIIALRRKEHCDRYTKPGGLKFGLLGNSKFCIPYCVINTKSISGNVPTMSLHYKIIQVVDIGNEGEHRLVKLP